MSNSFFAMLFRMKYIERWGLMRSNFPENLSEHSLEVAILSQALAVIGNKLFERNYDCDRVCVKAIFHDAPEILTGDMPTPVKYYSEQTKKAYDTVEDAAKIKFADSLPEEIRDAYADIFDYTPDEKKIIKAADKLSAYIKCKAEIESGNKEFSVAVESIEKALKDYDLPELDYFIEHFGDSFSMPIDLI